MLTTVATFQEPWEAYMLRFRLEAEGIPAVVSLQYHVWMNWSLSTALGGVKVQVPRGHAHEARSIERRCRAGEFKAELEAEFGDLDDPRCPICGSIHYRKRRSIPQSLLAVVLTLSFGEVFPPWRWVRRCKQCGAKWST